MDEYIGLHESFYNDQLYSSDTISSLETVSKKST